MTSVSSSAAMKLLDVRLKHAGAIITSELGEFTADPPGSGGTGPHQEIVCLRAGGTIDLYRIVITKTSSGNTNDDDEGVTTTNHHEKPGVTIVVEDNGPGVADDDRELIF